MKNILAAALIVSLFLSQGAVNISANHDDDELFHAKREERREQQRIRKEKIRLQLEDQKEELTERIEQKRLHVAAVHANRLEKRFMHFYERLLDFIARLQDRLNTMADEGKDVSKAQAKLEEAKSKLEEAKNIADVAIAGFKAIEPGDIPHQREQAHGAIEVVRQAKAAYKQVFNLLKQTVKLANEANE